MRPPLSGSTPVFALGLAMLFPIAGAARASCAPTGNVDVAADDATRVKVMWGLIGQVVDDLDSSEKDNKKKFLLHVSWHEGAFLRERSQIGGGPGRSFFQFEAPLAKDAVLYAKQKGWLGRLATTSGLAEKELTDAANAITGGAWPANNAIEKALRESDLFGAYLARIALKKVPANIPSGNDKHAEYWADHWKKVFSSPQERARLIAVVKAEADQVDMLIP